MAFLANVKPPEVGCGCFAGPCPVLPVKGELAEMHKAGCLAKHKPEHPVLRDWSSPGRRTKVNSGSSLQKQKNLPLPYLSQIMPTTSGWSLHCPGGGLWRERRSAAVFWTPGTWAALRVIKWGNAHTRSHTAPQPERQASVSTTSLREAFLPKGDPAIRYALSLQDLRARRHCPDTLTNLRLCHLGFKW